MNPKRLCKGGLFLMLVAALAGCLGTQPAASGGGSPDSGAILENNVNSGVGNEVASQPKPLPGGAVGTGDSWGDDAVFAVQGKASRCEQTFRAANGGSVIQIKTTLTGQVVAIEEGKKIEGPQAAPPTVSYLRLMDVNGASVNCTDLKLDSDAHFEGEIQISAPANVKFILFMVNFFGFGSNLPDCDPQYDPLSSENPPKWYGPVKSEVDFSVFGAEDLPKCGETR